ncbi:MAG TPA: hypothetical protein VNH20_06770 [Candidatus Dormibacteraeota bacterium]|nr:hypothetical protein [Candidatus Dormibacteraeota bacterium]
MRSKEYPQMMTPDRDSRFRKTRREILRRQHDGFTRTRILRRYRSHLENLDRVLADLEDARIRERRVVPPQITERLRQTEVAQEDPDLAQVVSTSRPSIDRVQDAVFDAQGRIMVEVSRLLGQPDWVSIEAEEGEALELEAARH